MEQIMTDSDMVDLYEEMLYERAANGIRPVLYVSSDKDLECSVLMLLNKPAEVWLAVWQQPAASGIRYHGMKKVVSPAGRRPTGSAPRTRTRLRHLPEIWGH